jgi:hypothetical protein
MRPHHSLSRSRTTAQRFFDLVDVTDGCWMWQGMRIWSGYGRFSILRRPIAAHRWAYEFCIGPIPEGLTIDHLCRTRACVNPNHLEAVTNLVNVRRGTPYRRNFARRSTARGRTGERLNTQRTHCTKGHLLDEENGRLERDGYLRCKTCRRKQHDPD